MPSPGQRRPGAGAQGATAPPRRRPLAASATLAAVVSLHLPASLVGELPAVRRVWRPIIRSAIRTGEWPAPDDLTDVEQFPGLIALAPAPLLAGERHVHAFVPAALVRETAESGAVSREVEDALVTQALGAPWSVLTLLCPQEQLLVIAPERHRAVATAAARVWPELDAPGARYTFGLREGAALWSLPSGLRYVLGQLGIPAEKVGKDLPPGGLATLLREASID